MKVLNSFIGTVTLSIVILSCKKSAEDTPASAAAITAGTFTCIDNDVAYTADSAHYSLCNLPTVNTIFGYKEAGVARRFFEINIYGIANACFTLSVSGFNSCALHYANGSTNSGGGGQANAGGAITIYDNANNKITATFFALLGPNTLTEGVFTSLMKK